MTFTSQDGNCWFIYQRHVGISKLRSNFAALLRSRDEETSSSSQQSDTISVDHHVTTKDGYSLSLRWYTRKATVYQEEVVDLLKPAVLYLQDSKVALKINCDKVGKGLKIRASCIYGTTDWFTQTGTTYSTSYRDPSLPPMISPDAPLNFKLEYQPSGNTADMGTVYAQLVVEEHAIKNDWWTQLTLVDISPYLEVRGVLDLPGAINQYTSRISTPQQINTLSRQSWFGQPTARAEWRVKGQ